MMTLDYTKWVERIKERSAPLRPLPTGEQPVLKYLEGVKAVLFDVYGTLIISGSGDIDEIKDDGKKRIDIQSLLNDYGIDMDPSTLHTAFKHEVRKVHEIKKAKGILFPEVRYEEIWSQVIDSLSGDRLLRFGLEYEMISNPVYPMPHMAETLSFCKELKRSWVSRCPYQDSTIPCFYSLSNLVLRNLLLNFSRRPEPGPHSWV